MEGIIVKRGGVEGQHGGGNEGQRGGAKGRRKGAKKPRDALEGGGVA